METLLRYFSIWLGTMFWLLVGAVLVYRFFFGGKK